MSNNKEVNNYPIEDQDHINPNANSDEDDDIEEANFIQTYDTDNVIRNIQQMNIRENQRTESNFFNANQKSVLDEDYDGQDEQFGIQNNDDNILYVDEDGNVINPEIFGGGDGDQYGNEEYVYMDEDGNVITDENGNVFKFTGNDGNNMGGYIFVDENGQFVDMQGMGFGEMDDIVNEDGEYSYAYNQSEYPNEFQDNSIAGMGTSVSAEFKEDLNKKELTLEDLVFKYDMSDHDLYRLYEASNTEVNNYISEKENLEKMIKVFNGNFDSVVIDNTDDEQKTILYSFVASIFLSFRNSTIKNAILEHQDLLDLFFSPLYDSVPSDDWWEAFYSVARRCRNSIKIFDYFKIQEGEKTKGEKFFQKLFEQIDNPVCMKQINHLFSEDPTSTLKWTDLDFINLAHLIANCFKEITLTEYNYESELKASNICSFCEIILSKDNPVSKSFEQSDTVKIFTDIIFSSENPHPVANHCLQIMLKLFPLNVDMTSEDLLKSLVENLFSNNNSLKNLKSQLEKPTLQVVATALGLYRQSLIQFINTVLKTSIRPQIIKNLAESGAISVGIEKLFIHRKNNVVHLTVYEIILSLLSEDIIDISVQSILEPYKLVDKLIQALEHKDHTYAPFIVNISTSLESLKEKSPENHKKLLEREDWKKFYEEKILTLKETYRPLTDVSSLPQRSSIPMFSFLS
jgi:hypothetical protein